MAMGRWHGGWLQELPGTGNCQQIQRALGAPELLARDLQVPHRGKNGFMPHEELDGTRSVVNIRAVIVSSFLVPLFSLPEIF